MTTERIDIVIAETGSRTVKRSIEDVGKSAATAEGAVSLLNRTLGLIGLGLGVSSFIHLADAATQMKNRLTVLGGSSAQVSDQLNLLFHIANTGRQSIESLVDVYQKGALAAKDLGASQKDLAQFTTVVESALRIQGVSSEQASGALLQLGQSLSTGVVHAQEFNSILQNAFVVAQAAAKGIDRVHGSVSQLRNEIIAGHVTSKEFFHAIISQYDELLKVANSTAPTIGQSFTVLRNHLVQFVGNLNDAVQTSRIFSNAILLVANNLDKVLLVLTVLGSIGAFNFITRQLLLMGTAGAGVLTFLTQGFVNLGLIIGLLASPFVRIVGVFGLLVTAIATATRWIAAFGFAEVAILALQSGMAFIAAPFIALRAAIAGLSLASLLGGLRSLVIGAGLVSLATIGMIAGFALLAVAVVGIAAHFGGLSKIWENVVNAFKTGMNGIISTFAAWTVAISKAWDTLFSGDKTTSLGEKMKIVGATFASNFSTAFDESMKTNDPFSGVKEAATHALDAFKNLSPVDLSVDELKKKIQELSEEITKGGNAMDTLNKHGKKTFADYLKDLQDEVKLTAMSNSEQDRYAKLFQINNNLRHKLTADQKAQLSALLDQIDANKRVADTYDEINAQQKKITEGETTLNELAKRGMITAQQLAFERKRLHKDAITDLQQEIDLTKLSSREQEIQRGLLQAEESLRRPLVDAERAQVQAMLELIRAQKEEQDMLNDIHGAQDALIHGQDTLNRLFSKGAITATEFADKLRQLKIAALETGRDLESGIRRGLLKIEEEFGNVASVAEEVMVNSFRSIEDALVKFVQTGKLDFKSLVDSILADITRLAVRQAITAPLARWLGGVEGSVGGGGGGGGGGFGNIFGTIFGGGFGNNGGGFFNTIGNIFKGGSGLFGPGFANGGDFTVGGNGYGTDQQMVAFRATKGESVSITPRGQAQGGGRPISVVMNIQTPDAESFERSQSQILARTQAALTRANYRNN